MKIFIDYRDQRNKRHRHALPVNPEHLKLTRTSDNQTTEIVSLGEINRLGPSKLMDFSIESFFPARTKLLFINLFERIQRERRPCKFIVGKNINIVVSVESFAYEHRAGTDDIYYSVAFKEHRVHQARRVNVSLRVPRIKPPKPKPRPTPSPRITVGSIVIVNGRLHRDSYGAGPGQTERNATRRVSHHVPGRRCPFHVKTLEGGWRGWVTEASVKLR